MDRLMRMLSSILKRSRRRKQWRILSTVLAGIVVFVTTYSFILPAITLEERAAAETPGIYLNTGEDIEEEEWSEEWFEDEAAGGIDAEDDFDWYDETADDDFEDDEYSYEDVDEEDVDGSGGAADEEDGSGCDGASDADRLSPEADVIADDVEVSFIGEAGSEGSVSPLSELTGELSDEQGRMDIGVRLTFGPEEDIPGEAELHITEISRTADEAAELYRRDLAASEEALGEAYPGSSISRARFFDLSLAAAGEKVEPTAEVGVEMTFAEPLRAERVAVLCFAEGRREQEEQQSVSIPCVLDEVQYSYNEDGDVVGAAFRTDQLGVLGIAEMMAAEEQENYPAQSFTASTEDVRVQVFAEEGAFPEGTAMTVSAVEDEDTISAISEAAEDDENKVRKIHAVEITFLDAAGNEIEPRKPVRVEMTSEEVGENEKAVVVHVDDDGNAEALEDVEVVSRDDSAFAEVTEEGEYSVSGEDGEVESVAFDADEFSIYAIVYTVDFHWEVDGKIYTFSMPGGGFVSFTDLIQVLDIAIGDNNAANGAKSDDANVEDEALVNVATDVALALDGIEISKETRKFVEDVEKVEFSSPESVWSGKADKDTTVGELKNQYGLNVEYSAELTEEQIDQINGKNVSAGDWALISLKAFDTEESLTVTMNTGEVFKIKVTDYQVSTHVLTADGDTYRITITYDDTAGIPDNAELRAAEVTEEDDRYNHLCDEAAQVLIAKYEAGLSNPLLFDIGIYVNKEEIEPAAGSTVSVEIWLESDAQDRRTDSAESSDEENKGIDDSIQDGIWIQGKLYTTDGTESYAPVVVHHTDDGATVLSDIEYTEEMDGSVTLKFDTDSFSSYTITNSSMDVAGLPSTLYVGDEIYLSGQYTSSSYITVGGGYTALERGDSNHRVIKLDKEGTLTIGSKRITVKAYPTQSSTPDTIETINNSDAGITLNLFDYDLDGVLNESWNQNGYWTGANTNNPYKWYFNYGINNGKILKFWTGCPGYDTPYNNTWDVGQYSASPGIVSDRLAANGYPTVTKGTQTDNLSYLFAPSSDSNKEVYTNVDGLFYKDTDGYYVYDSYINYAYFNGSKFEVYNTTFSYGSGSDTHKIGFFPFHPYNEAYESTLSTISGHQQMNHHFGMTMEVKFMLPDDGIDPITGKPVTFKFNGDDDMWVYVDDVLRLDLGGIHQPVDGEINFATLISNGIITKTGANNVHTLKVFYIERGGGDSNCKITFNTTMYKDVEFEKKDESDDIPLKGAKFQIFDENGAKAIQHVVRDGQGNLVYEGGTIKRSDWIIESDSSGKIKIESLPVGTYMIKEIEAPEGYVLDASNYFYAKVSVDQSGNVTSKLYRSDNTEVTKITNKPYGYLRIQKNVTYNGNALGEAHASELVGTYTFTLYMDAGCTQPYQESGSNKTISITIGTDGQAVTSEAVRLPARQYWIKETASTNEDAKPITEVIQATVTKEHTSESPLIQVYTNNKQVETVDITAAKQWQDKDGTVLDGTEGKRFPENASVTFTLLANGQATSHIVEVNGEDETADSAIPQSTDYEGADWTAYFTQLPKYTSEGDPITYTVQETGTWDGFEVDGSDVVNGGGTIINKEKSLSIDILKVNKNTGSALSGAKFQLKKYSEGYQQVLKTWDEAEVSMSNDETKGILTIEGLSVGFYELEETISPTGYIKTVANPRFQIVVNSTTKDLEVQFTDNTNGMVSYSGGKFTVKNEPGAALPNTGGPGTDILYLFGSIMAMLAGMLLLFKRRGVRTS